MHRADLPPQEPTRRARRFRAAAAVLLLGPALAAVGCGHRAPPAGGQLGPPRVLCKKAITRTVTDYEEATGRTEAVTTVEVRARVTGYLKRIAFKDGQEVKEGDLLFEIDPRPYEAELERARANVGQSEARLNRLDLDFERAKVLYGRGAMGREDFDRISGDRAEAEAALRVARAAEKLAQLNVDYTRVKAPCNGLLSRRYVDTGNLVKADDTVLTTLVNLDEMYAYFDVDERTVVHLAKLQRQDRMASPREKTFEVQLALAGEEGFPHHGTIDFIDNRLDAGTGTLRLRGRFPNPRHGAERLFAPGMFIRIRVPVSPPTPRVLIPERAIQTDQGDKKVYVVEEFTNDQGQKADRVVYRRIEELGALQPDGLRVVLKGVREGERVVTGGLQRIRPNIEVTAAEDQNDSPTAVSRPAPPPAGGKPKAAPKG
ncbi:MAG TPA: efflux RND transporter periplasmic adaptor subunit [Gemmataceae bacterium]|nr:efflux RND transporter periplasmic adaptor subunit [Gemmataceae bacterium]